MDDGSPVRLGFLYPGHAAEDDYPEFARMVAAPVVAEVVHTALGAGGDAHTVAALRDMGESGRLAAGAEELSRRGVASAVWACTSGSFTYGWQGAQRQAGALAERLGVPASSTSLAFVHALEALGIARVAVAATYPQDVADCFAEFLADAGIRVCELAASGIMSATDAGNLESEATVRMVSAADRPDAEAVIVPDTALRTAGVLGALEKLLDKPVLTANQVSMWEAMRLASVPAPHADAGRLFSSGAAGRAESA